MTEPWRRTHDWGSLTRAEIAAARDAGALPVLTVGSVEQHADHLPVDTDTLLAYRVAIAAAERCDAPHVLVLPPPAFGYSPHHRSWAGTITLSMSYQAGNAPDVMRPAGAVWAMIFAKGDVGYVGDPAAATRESGQAMIELTVDALARFYADFATAQLRVGE